MKQRIEIEDFLRIRYLSNPNYSPDGRFIAFTVTEADREKNAYPGDVWIYETESGKTRQLTTGGDAKSYFWSEDGKIVFPAKRSRENKRRTEVGETFTSYCAIDPEGGEAAEIFEVPLAVSRIMPLGNDLYAVISLQKNTPRNNAYEVLEEVPYWYNGMGFCSGDRRRLYLYNRSTGELKALTDEWTEVAEIDVRGTKLVYQATPWRNFQQFPYAPALHLYDLVTGEDRTVMEVDTWNDFRICFWKDNEVLFSALKGYPGNGMGQNADFYTVDLSSGKSAFFAGMDSCIGYGGSGSDAKMGGGNGKKLVDDVFYFITPLEDGTYLNSVDYSGHIVKRILDEGGTADSVESFDIFDGHIAECKMPRNGLVELYIDGRQVTHINDAYLGERYVSSPEYHSFTASDGYEIHGWAMKPYGYVEGRKYPAILHIHGGPKTVFGDIYHHEMQVWASKGYFVIFCNPRGSDGRGREFADINGIWGTVDYQNIMDFTDEMLRICPDIDEKRVGVCGGSYGGFMVNWVIGHTDRFAAACSQRSIANLINFEYLSDIGHTSILSEHLITVEENFTKAWDDSPLKYAPNCKTPTLFIQSDNDYRCYMADALSMFSALKRTGCPAKVCLFHGESHELSRSGKPENRISRMKEICDWFDQYLQNNKEDEK